MRFRLLALLACLLLLTTTNLALMQASPVTEHPRLWMTADTLPALQAAANENNPIWVQLSAIAEEASADMDSGAILNGDPGTVAYVDYPSENYAMLFAFMSLIHPDAAARADYAARARTLLMTVMTQAAEGPADAPFRYEDFTINDRSRWFGAGFGLTVDWIYPTLTPEDRALINTVFVRWCDELRNAYMTNNNHPEPIGVTNDPILLADRGYARWANNNYYAAHMRNMGLMALALDPSDNPGGEMATCLNEATGAWLYVLDDILRNESEGGMGAEGYEYSPQTLGYTAEFLLALYTAGQADVAARGQQVSFDANPFWDDSITAYLHSLSPATAPSEYDGEVYLPAWYGSGQRYMMPDHIQMFGAMGVYDRLTGNTDRLNALQWIQLNTAPGLADRLLERVDFQEFTHAILYFMLFQDGVGAPSDPRETMETVYYAPGLQRLLARTDWSPDAEWFTYSLSWNGVDHQSANGNALEFYRNGEWLTQTRVGYDLDYIASDNMNTLLIQNTRPDRDDWRLMIWERGSQWLYIPAGDPPEPTITQGDGYIAVHGDATNLYNSDYEGVFNVQEATRSVVWLQPDVLVVYDHAVTETPSFRRFVLNLPAAATTDGSVTTMISPNGQQFTIHSILPADAALSVTELADEISSPPAEGVTVTHRYVAESTGTDTYFLHVLVGSDAGGAQPTIEVISSDPAAPVLRINGVEVSFAGETITVGG